MELQSWIPAITSTSLFAATLWLLRSLIGVRLTKSVQHEFDSKLEALRTKFRNSEESFRAELRSKDDAINSLRNSAITGFTNRQLAIDKRRIEAVDQLWSSVASFLPCKFISSLIASLNIDVVVKKSTNDSRIRQMFETMGQSFESTLKLNDLQPQGKIAYEARPYLTEYAWALYSAYSSIVTMSVTQLQMLRVGIDARTWLKIDAMVEMLKAALPHQTPFIDKYGIRAAYHLLDDLELHLLSELQSILRGDQTDKDNVEKAAVILTESKRFADSIMEAKNVQAIKD